MIAKLLVGDHGVLQIRGQVSGSNGLANRKAASRQLCEICHLEAAAKNARHAFGEAAGPHECLYPSAVMAKPFGTRTPALVSS